MKLSVPIKPQPDETTCGPTCLHAVYEYYKHPVEMSSVILDVLQFENGGTFGSLLAVDALHRGFDATIYTYNLQVFDPSWFDLDKDELKKKMMEQISFKKDEKLRTAIEAYHQFLELGGKLKFEDLRSGILRRYLKKDQPIIVGLSATFLYRSMREYGPNQDYDDIRGEPTGHFVVLHGYNRETRMVSVADPLMSNPISEGQFYEVSIDRVINAILLGIVTYDANLIIITPKKPKRVK
ncbi:MAG: C39 family peptidase [Balneolaceae bacterium]